jgi:hypothetical protein
VVSVAWKLGTIEERSQNQSFYLCGESTATKATTSKNLFWFWVPVKIISVALKLDMTEHRQNRSCFGEEITGTKVTNPKTVLGSSPGEFVPVIFNCKYQAYDKFSASKG